MQGGERVIVIHRIENVICQMVINLVRVFSEERFLHWPCARGVVGQPVGMGGRFWSN